MVILISQAMLIYRFHINVKTFILYRHMKIVSLHIFFSLSNKRKLHQKPSRSSFTTKRNIYPGLTLAFCSCVCKEI